MAVWSAIQTQRVSVYCQSPSIRGIEFNIQCQAIA